MAPFTIGKEECFHESAPMEYQKERITGEGFVYNLSWRPRCVSLSGLDGWCQDRAMD